MLVTTSPIGLKLSVDYSDQNESFKPFLPRYGSITRQVSLDDWGDDWFVFTLDEPFEYQMETDKPFHFKVIKVNHFLIRSRWAGHSIGSSDETALFVLLDPDNRIEHQKFFSSRDFFHVCWGMTKPAKT